MKRVSSLLIMIIIMVILAIGFFSYGPLLGSLNLGLDLQGGVHVVLQAEEKEGVEVTDNDMEQLKSVMRHRVDELGVSEPIIQREAGNRLIVELAGVDDPEEAVDVIGKTALLEFKTEEHGIVLTGRDLSDARAVIDPRTNEPIIEVNFQGDAAEKFYEVTLHLYETRGQLSIVLDDQVLTSPFVDEPIPGGEAIIRGGFQDYEEAVNLAALLRGGALPVDVEILEMRTVGPQLGVDSLERSINAALIGVSLIVLFMLACYKVTGLIATLALIIYGILVLLVLNTIEAVLTLPGIAGLLLSIGMAVDANIIIFERIKEELRKGKSLRAGVDSGFKKAVSPILDANITTLIGAGVLFYFGTGLIKGFAVTLSLGIVASMITAFTLSRFLYRTFVRTRGFDSLKLYGVKGGSIDEG